MAHVAQMLTQEPIYKFYSIFCFKPILLSAHKLILLIYGDNTVCLASTGKEFDAENSLRVEYWWYPGEYHVSC